MILNELMIIIWKHLKFLKKNMNYFFNPLNVGYQCAYESSLHFPYDLSSCEHLKWRPGKCCIPRTMQGNDNYICKKIGLGRNPRWQWVKRIVLHNKKHLWLILFLEYLKYINSYRTPKFNGIGIGICSRMYRGFTKFVPN